MAEVPDYREFLRTTGLSEQWTECMNLAARNFTILTGPLKLKPSTDINVVIHATVEQVIAIAGDPRLAVFGSLAAYGEMGKMLDRLI